MESNVQLAGRQAEQLGGHGHIIINHISVSLSLSLRFSVSLSIDNQQGVGQKGRGVEQNCQDIAKRTHFKQKRAKLAKRNETK